MRIKRNDLKKLIESFLLEQEGAPPGAETEAPPGADSENTSDPDAESGNEEDPGVDTGDKLSDDEDEEQEDEEQEQEANSIESEEISFKSGKLEVSFREAGEDIKVTVKEMSSGEDISNSLKEKHGSALLIRLFRRAQKDKNKELLKSTMHFIKKYHKDLPEDSNEMQVSEWIRSKIIRYALGWIDDIDLILNKRSDKKSIS